MKIGIIVAMTKELELLLPLIEGHFTEDINGVTIYKGTLGHHQVAVLQSGIGKVNAAIGAMCLIDTFQPDLVINSGVAGGTGEGACKLDVVLGDRVAYHDVWCGPCSEAGQIQGMPKYFNAPSEVIAKACLDEDLDVRVGLIASGDQFVDNVEALDRIKGLYPEVLAVDMESAPIAHVCHVRNVPFVSLRVISDTPGVADNTAQYESFWEDAPRHTFKTLLKLINNL